MFATQPRLFNPIEKFDRTEEIIFAGSWYKGIAARCEEMERIFDSVLDSPFPLKIYDRHSKSKGDYYVFPKRFHPYIYPALRHSDLEVAYKSSKYALNINTVTDSDTMFARRVFELMSSNTFVLSNYSRGVERLFGDGVSFFDKEYKFTVENADSKRLKNLCYVLKHHTYKNRFEQILRTIGIPYRRENISAAFLYIVESLEEAGAAISNFNKIQFHDKAAYLIVGPDADRQTNREITEQYNGCGALVFSGDYCRRYDDVLAIAQPFFIWADSELKNDFPDKAILHYQYLDNDTGVTLGNRVDAYKISPSPFRFNAMYPASMFKASKKAFLCQCENSKSNIKTYFIM